jgi:hypothetical protein
VSDEQEKIPLEKAVSMLAKKSNIHTFRSSPGMLIGADWPKKKLISAMKKHGVGPSGPSACAMGYCLVLIDDRGPLFIEAKEQP